MNPVSEHLLNAALALSEDDRLQFVEALIVSLQPTDRPPFDDSWLAEIQRRSAEIDAGTAKLTPWAEVKLRVRQRLEGRANG